MNERISQAFPAVGPGSSYENGMNMREWYAGMALQGLVWIQSRGSCMESAGPTAELAFIYADAMLAEAKKGQS